MYLFPCVPWAINSKQFPNYNKSLIFTSQVYKKQKPQRHQLWLLTSCTGRETRTPDTRFWRPMLYQLSYSRVCGCKGTTFFDIAKCFGIFFASWHKNTRFTQHRPIYFCLFLQLERISPAGRRHPVKPKLAVSIFEFAFSTYRRFFNMQLCT